MSLLHIRGRASLLLCVISVACRDYAPVETSSYRTEPIQEDFRAIADPHARWDAYNLGSYVLTQTRLCFCPGTGDVRVIVEEGRITDVIRKSDGASVYTEAASFYKTVDELFAFALSVRQDSVAELRVEYDQRFGFPRLVYIDYDDRIADEELGFRTEGLERLIR